MAALAEPLVAPEEAVADRLESAEGLISTQEVGEWVTHMYHLVGIFNCLRDLSRALFSGWETTKSSLVYRVLLSVAALAVLLGLFGLYGYQWKSETSIKEELAKLNSRMDQLERAQVNISNHTGLRIAKLSSRMDKLERKEVTTSDHTGLGIATWDLSSRDFTSSTTADKIDSPSFNIAGNDFSLLLMPQDDAEPAQAGLYLCGNAGLTVGFSLRLDDLEASNLSYTFPSPERCWGDRFPWGATPRTRFGAATVVIHSIS